MDVSHDLAVAHTEAVSTALCQLRPDPDANPTLSPPKKLDSFETMASRQEVLHAYRHLYKGLLRGVQHAIPARYIVRDQIRSAFRDRTAAAAAAPWDAEAIRRTLWFLSAAGRHTGLEHKILRNLVRMHSERVAPTRRWRKALIWDKKP